MSDFEVEYEPEYEEERFSQLDGEPLYTNDNYAVVLGVFEGDYGYGLLNTKTGVVEVLTRILPKAKWFADQFNNMIINDTIDPYVVDLAFVTPDDVAH